MDDDDYYNVDGPSFPGGRGSQNSFQGARNSNSSYGGAPPPTASARPGTSAAAVKGAGFSSTGPKYGGHDSHGQHGRGPAPALVQKSENSDMAYCKELERQVHERLEESSFASAEGNYPLALERAKEAEKKERQLWKKRAESRDEAVRDSNNAELTYAVRFNLANQLHLNKLYGDAMNLYEEILRDPKGFSNPGQLRANMGNILFEQAGAAASGKQQADLYNKAIRMYRMALDIIPRDSITIRYRIQRNVGHALVRLGKYTNAMESYADVMNHSPDLQTGFNLVVCNYGLGRRDDIKKAFQKLVQLQPVEEEEVDDEDGLGQDALKEELRRRKNAAKHAILTAARLIAPTLGKSGWEEGFDWIIDHLKKQRQEELAGEIEMEKALEYLKKRDFDTAVKALREFHRKDLAQGIKARAATNLSFLYFLESDDAEERGDAGKALRQEDPLAEAERYAKTAVDNDRYNARALVNLGACLFRRGQVEAAKLKFQQAADVEADCVEAVYNLGMAQKALGQYYDALASFTKVRAILPNAREPAFQTALCHDALGNHAEAVKALEQLNAEAGVDPSVLVRLGAIHAKANDTIRALQYYSDAHALCPANMECVTWLGAYHFHSPYLERALPFFDLAARLRPNEVKWALVAANCHRRVKNLPEALERFQKINRKHPENIECLKNLVSVCTELNLVKEAERYQQMKERIERQQPNEATTTAGAAPVPAPFPPQAPAQPAAKAPAEANWDGDAGYRSAAPARDPYGDAGGGKGPAPKQRQKGEDDWGQEVLGDDLLPM